MFISDISLQFSFFVASLSGFGIRVMVASQNEFGSLSSFAIFLKSLSRMPLLLLSHFSRVRLCATPETAAHQAPPSMGFSRQEYWSGLPLPSPLSRIGVSYSLNFWQNSAVKLSGPGLLFAGRFLITVSISMLMMGLIDFLFLPVSVLESCTFLRISPFLPSCPFYL